MFSFIAYIITWAQHHQNHWSLSAPVRQITICQEQLWFLVLMFEKKSAYERKDNKSSKKNKLQYIIYSDVYSPYVHAWATFELFMYFFQF